MDEQLKESTPGPSEICEKLVQDMKEVVANLEKLNPDISSPEGGLKFHLEQAIRSYENAKQYHKKDR